MGESRCIAEPDRLLSPEDTRLQAIFANTPYEQRKKVIVAHRVSTIIGTRLGHGSFVSPASNEQIIDYVEASPIEYAAILETQEALFDIESGYSSYEQLPPAGYTPLVKPTDISPAA